MIDIVRGLRRIAEEGYRFAGDAADEIERLRAQNAVLIDAINAAAALMASAPAWHEMHQEAVAELRRVKKGMES